jgi:uncharacterized protein YndB with AHSA1/START domain
MAELDAIRVDQFLAHPPAKVWQALTDPKLLAQWLMPNAFLPIIGHRFRFTATPGANFDGIVHCQVLELRPPQLLRISWSGDDELDSEVVWRLEREGTGTRLFINQTGFDPADPKQQSARRTMDGGWRTRLINRLVACLDTTT